MAPNARQGTVRPCELTRCAEIAPPQDKLNQLAHLNRVDWLCWRTHLFR
jgi:hypothetical protein